MKKRIDVLIIRIDDFTEVFNRRIIIAIKPINLSQIIKCA